MEHNLTMHKIKLYRNIIEHVNITIKLQAHYNIVLKTCNKYKITQYIY